MKLPSCSDSISREIEARAISLKARGAVRSLSGGGSAASGVPSGSVRENTACGFAGCRFTPRTRASPVSVLTR